MNLYLISQDANWDYDTFDAAIVAAKSKKEAQMIHPSKKDWDGTASDRFESWTSFENVSVKLIGTAKKGTPKGVILKSFNAG